MFLFLPKECSFTIPPNHNIHLSWKCEIYGKVEKKKEFQDHPTPLQVEKALLNFDVFLSSHFCDGWSYFLFVLHSWDYTKYTVCIHFSFNL